MAYNMYSTSATYTYTTTSASTDWISTCWISTYQSPPTHRSERPATNINIEVGWNESTKKALALLKKSLTKEQLKRFKQDECIPIDTAKGNKYLIEKKNNINILELTKDNKPKRRLCTVLPQCPIYDNMLAQKLFLESSEDDFLKIANVYPV